MVDFSKYKANRESNKEKLAELLKTQEQTSKTVYANDDARYWKPVMDTVKKVGGAVIRFLPEGNEENLLNYVKYFEHSFKNPENGKWYIERSLSSLPNLGQDSVAILNRKLWGTSPDKDHPTKKLASKQKRNTKYISNILVVNDPANPDNNGKVFLYKFGPAIYNKIDAVKLPKEDAITGVKPDSLDPFCIIDGANFELRINDTKDGWNYDDSKFSTPTPMAKSDAVFDAVLKQVYDLTEFIAETNYKTKDALDKRLLEVLGISCFGYETVEGHIAPVKSYTKEETESPARKQTEAPSSSSKSELVKEEVPFETQNDEDFFNNLMKEV